MTAKEIREKYLDFFTSKGHKVIPSASLVPENDPTVLFTTAGMHPLVPFLLGESHPKGKRLVNFQKCIRTQDIDEVGDKTHDTFFEMLGNWSLGDYFKKEAIEWSWEFLTDKKWLGLDSKNMAISCFAGDDEMNVAKDEESAEIWRSLGVPAERIAFLGVEDNWWGPAGETGPCGPDTEMFYWNGEDAAPKKFDPKDESWIEIWNDVFMEYNKTASGKYEPLDQKNVDTGMGLERTAMVLQKKDSIFETDLFLPILKKVQQMSGEQDEKAERIVTDHVKAATFIIADGVQPSNLDRGYVLRRLIRRAIRYGKKLALPDNFLPELSKVVLERL